MECQTQNLPTLEQLLRRFNTTHDEMPAAKFYSTSAYQEFASDLVDYGVSFRVKLLKRRNKKTRDKAHIVVMLLQVIDMERAEYEGTAHGEEEFDDFHPDEEVVDIIGMCPSCGVLMSNHQWCKQCGESINTLYEGEHDVTRH